MVRRARIRVENRRGSLRRVRLLCAARAPLALCVAAVAFAPIVAGSAGASATLLTIAMVAEGDAIFPTAYPIVDRVPPEGVVEMRVRGFHGYARAVAEQCLAGELRSCANRIPVQFDEDGEATFQYLIGNDFLPAVSTAGGCRANTGRCTIVVRSIDGQTRSEVQTIFIDSVAPPGTIEVTPSAGLSLDGEIVTVSVRNFPPGANVNAMMCASPSVVGDRCGAPGGIAAIAVGPDGSGETQLFIAPGPVGIDGARCFRGDTCGVSVASDSVFARAPVVPISFEGPIGARYSATKLALWLAIALLLIGVAALLLRRTDWSAVGEAAAPEIDDAEYADLDAIIAALPPEVEEVALVSPSPRRAS